jgi:hypothetical protein
MFASGQGKGYITKIEKGQKLLEELKKKKK